MPPDNKGRELMITSILTVETCESIWGARQILIDELTTKILK